MLRSVCQVYGFPRIVLDVEELDSLLTGYLVNDQFPFLLTDTTLEIDVGAEHAVARFAFGILEERSQTRRLNGSWSFQIQKPAERREYVVEVS